MGSCDDIKISEGNNAFVLVGHGIEDNTGSERGSGRYESAGSL